MFWRFLIYFSDSIKKDWRQNLCTESKTVFAAHPEDCSKFFICHAHRAFPVDCSAGTLYDKKLKICNHAYAVDCKKEPSKAAPTITKTIKTTKETTRIPSTTNIQNNHDIYINRNGNHQNQNHKGDNKNYTALTVPTITTTSEKTDPCLKKGIGINPRDVVIGLDPKCEESLALTKKDLLKAIPNTTEIIKTTVIEKTTTSEKTDPSPCLKKRIGINPRDVTLDLNSNCEENLIISESENQPTPPLPPCKLDIRLGDPEYDDIIFDTEKCDPLPTDSAKNTNKWQY